MRSLGPAMHEHRRHTGVLVVALALGLGNASPASADDPRVSKPLFGTAYTLQAHEAQLGIGLQAYGIVDRVTIGTLLAAWILPAFTDAFAPNVLIRYRFMDARRWSFALQTGMSWVRVKDANLIGTTKQTTNSIIFPFELRTSNRSPFGLLSSFEATYVAGQATLQDGTVIKDFRGGVVSSSLQFALAFEHPFSRFAALTLTGRVIAWVPKGRIDAVAVVDESNEIRVRGTITEKDVIGSYNVLAGMAFYTRRLFSLRVGAGYGRFIFPEIGFVYLETGPVIDFAAFVRF